MDKDKSVPSYPESPELKKWYQEYRRMVLKLPVEKRKKPRNIKRK
jgi:hypothetical protein